jgi:enoyl-CoA hydratase
VIVGRDGFFSAGVDLKLVPTLDRDGQRAMVNGINRLFLGWYSFPRPVVCAVNGHAIAGGLILALCGDHRIGCGVGKLGLTELRAGIGYPAAAMSIVRTELAAPAVRELALRAELVESGPAAVELGLLDELVEPDALLDRALEVAGELAALPRAAYPRVKDQLRGATVAELERIVEHDPMLREWAGEEAAAASAGILERPRGST